MLAARDWSSTDADLPPSTVRDRFAGRGVSGRCVRDITVSLVASALMAALVAVAGNAVQATSAAPPPASAAPLPAAIDRSTPIEGEETIRSATPTPDQMVWCRPLSGSTICIREKT
jgi:hypothetical protein